MVNLLRFYEVVKIWIQDMQPVWQAEKDAVTLTIPPEQVVFAIEAEIALPFETGWDYLMQPEFHSGCIRANIGTNHNCPLFCIYTSK